MAAGSTQLSIVALDASHGNSVSFVFYDDPKLEMIQPMVGPQLGGTRVRVTGRIFRDTGAVFCIFGALSTVRAQWLSPSTMDCITPRHISGTVEFSVSLNGQQYSVTPAVNFTYQHTPQLLAISPDKSPIKGGTEVVISGRHFSVRSAAVGLLRCRFGSTSVAATLASEALVRCQSPAGSVGYSTVALTDNGYDFSGSLPFEYIPTAVLSVSPAHGPIQGGTFLQLSGHSISPAKVGLECVFAGFMFVPAQFVSSTELQCRTPPSVTEATVSVQLSRAGLVLEGEAMFVYAREAVVTGLVPSSGPLRGGTVVTINGRHLKQRRSDLFCRFGSSIVPARHLSRSGLECVSPPLSAAACPIDCREGQSTTACHLSCNRTAPTTVSVWVTSNDQNFILSNESFSYDSDVLVQRLWPRHGPERGGTIITVFGLGFRLSRHILCRIADVAVAATILDASTVQCTAPRAHGYTSVEVSTNAVDYTQDGHTFWFSPAAVTGVRPTSGPMRGGTTIRVQGDSFVAEQIGCVFSETLFVQAWFESTGVVSCVAPPQLTAGPIPVTLISQQAMLAGNAWLHRIGDPSVDRIFPTAGPLTGGTAVTVSGVNLIDELEAVCRFAAPPLYWVVSARWLGSSRLQCITPQLDAPSQASLEVSMNGQDYTESGTALEFDFYLPIRVFKAMPAHGPMNGGTSVTLVGMNFERGAVGVLQCAFNNTIVAAHFMSSTEIICTSPPIGIFGLVAVEVTHNGRQFTEDGVLFEYIHVNLTRVVPPQGPVAGSTQVTFQGHNLWREGGEVYCAFDSMPNVVAAAVSSHEIRCLSPPREVAGRVSVRVHSHNGTLVTASFQYTTEVVVAKLQPAHGPAGGGTLVVVYGDNFVQSSNMLCGFGSRVVPARVLSQRRLECFSPTGAQVVNFGLSANSVDFAYTSSTFTYLPTLHIIATTPASGPLSGGSRVDVAIGGLSDFPAALAQLQCRFNSTSTAASVTSANSVACLSPPTHRAGWASLEVSNNNLVDFTSDGFTFQFVQVQVISLSPAEGPVAGGTAVRVIGIALGLTPSESIVCNFGNVSTEAVVESSSVVMCLTPAAAAAEVRLVELWNSGATYEGVVNFKYYSEPIIKGVYPPLGPERGGTIVVVSGANFGTAQAHCRFGHGSSSLAMWRSVGSVECVAPASSGVLDLAISFNGADFTSSVAAFEYHPRILVHTVTPRCGSVRGGGKLAVHGFSFESRAASLGMLSCKVGHMIVTAVFFNSTYLECPMPPNEAGFVTVEVSNNARDFSISGVLFRYWPEAVPQLAPLTGPILGGTLLLISSTSPTCATQLQCNFGSASVEASVVAAGTISCVTPPWASPGYVTLHIQQVGAGSSIGSALAFSFQLSPQLSQLHPSTGPLGGGTRVEILGRNFVPSQTLQCGFNTTLVAAGWLSSNRLVCVTPPMGTGGVAVSITNDGHSFVTMADTFGYAANVIVSSLTPAAGPIHGGTIVTASGVGFSEVAAQQGRLVCAYNHESDLAATYINSTSVLCSSPPMAQAATVSLEVSNNQQDFSHSRCLFEYHKMFTLTAVEPRVGPVHGGTRVVVRGLSFLSDWSLECNFGHAIVPASVISSSMLLCTTPPHGEAVVLIGVGLRDQNTSISRVGFTFQPQAAVSAVLPVGGPLAGDTQVQLIGSGFRSAVGLSCVFGRITVLARFISSGLVNCTAPPHAAGTVSVWATNDGAAVCVPPALLRLCS